MAGEKKIRVQQIKSVIADAHLIQKQIEEHGLGSDQLRFSAGAVLDTITLYTREAGVRNLERQLAAVCRKTARMRGIAADSSCMVILVQRPCAPMSSP